MKKQTTREIKKPKTIKAKKVKQKTSTKKSKKQTNLVNSEVFAESNVSFLTTLKLLLNGAMQKLKQLL